MWTPFLWVATARAGCTFHATPERLDAALATAERAYASLDVPAFERSMTEVDFVVPCLDAPVSPEVAARLHRMRGLGRFAAGDVPGADRSLQAARRLEPAYVFAEEMLPRGFELRDRYEALSTEPLPTQRLPRPSRDARPWIDGTPSRQRPVDTPTVWQLERGGALVETRYLEPSEPTPWYPGANRSQLPWIAGAGATGAAAAVAFGVAERMERRVTAPIPGDAGFSNLAALESHQRATNALALTGAGLATAAVAELSIGLWKGRRP